MANILNTLYPPLVDTFLPAFPADKKKNPKFTFSISPYNEIKDIEKVHVSLIKQKTNLNALKTNVAVGKWSTTNSDQKYKDNLNETCIQQGVWIVPKDTRWFTYDSDSDLFSLEIPYEILKNNESWDTQQFYKLQLRFDQSKNSLSDSYLLNNLDYFSEWSRVCLLKIIEPVDVFIRKFDNLPKDEDALWINAGSLPLAGYITFNGKRTSTSKEYMQSYQITIYETFHPDNILSQSDVIYTGDSANQNDINVLMDVANGKEGVKYSVKVNITTKNQYKFEKIYKNILAFSSYSQFTTVVKWDYNNQILSNTGEEQSPPKMNTEEDGIIDITFNAGGQGISSGYVYIRRASDLDNFKKWDLIKCVHVFGQGQDNSEFSVNVNIKDYTVGSLILYQYSAQFEDIKGNLGKTFVSDYVYPEFHDILLYENGRQLAVRLNGTIQSPKVNVNRQKVDTLGGKYPKFTENAQLNYKSFSISGYIDAESDYNRQFLNDTKYLYGEYPVPRSKNDYEYTLQEDPQRFGPMTTYNYYMDGKTEIRNDTYPDVETMSSSTAGSKYDKQLFSIHHDTYPKDNWWWQRKFRQEAVAWLNDGEPKLFRSMTEGNMVVMLTDISLTPVQQLGRRIYQFTCTAYEIADGYDLNTLSSLGIFNVVNEKTKMDQKAVNEELEKKGLGQYISLDFSSFEDKNQYYIFKGSMIDKLNTFNIYKYESFEEKLKNRVFEVAYNTENNFNISKKYNYVEDSLILKDVRIYFESKPQYYRLEDLILIDQSTLKDDTDYNSGLFYDNEISSLDNNNDDETNNSPIGLGYKISIKITNLENYIDIFVDARGYYQIPSDLEIEDLILYDHVKATIEYKYFYKYIYNSELLPEKVRVSKKVISQLIGMWTPGVYINNLLQQKHTLMLYNGKEDKGEEGTLKVSEALDNWHAVTLEMTPYAVVQILQSKNDTQRNYITVGRSGILNLSNNYQIEDICFYGKRMIQVPKEKQPYLEEWEYVLDISAETAIKNSAPLEELKWRNTQIPVKTYPFTTQDGRDIYEINRYWNNYRLTTDYIIEYPDNLSQIKNPKYNTVYAIDVNGDKKYYIYYIDGAWYNVYLWNSNDSWSSDGSNIILAEVPVHGVLTYQADIIRSEY